MRQSTDIKAVIVWKAEMGLYKKSLICMCISRFGFFLSVRQILCSNPLLLYPYGHITVISVCDGRVVLKFLTSKQSKHKYYPV